jgi:hypothetical protein
VTLIAMAGLAGALDAGLSARGGEATLVQRVIAEATRSGLTIRAARDLRAGTQTGKHQGWMAVETVQQPSGQLTWSVLGEGGSERTRNKVFRALLDGEAAAWRDGGADAGALTLANYQFDSVPSADDGLVRIRLTPRRDDPRLVRGTLTVSADGYPVVLEGTLAKSPSFWVRRVSIVKRFARINGITLPSSIESVADVRMVGPSIFSMCYHYREINGHSVAQGAASATSAIRHANYALFQQPASN